MNATPGIARPACRATVASGPIWENRPCMLPATYQWQGGHWCHVHAPKRLVRERREAREKARAAIRGESTT